MIRILLGSSLQKRIAFRGGLIVLGLAFAAAGVSSLVANSPPAYMFLGGFAFLTGLQVITWAAGIEIEMLGNVPAMLDAAREVPSYRQIRSGEYDELTSERAYGIADATRKAIDESKEAAQQLGVKATEYYDTERAEAGKYYGTARETAEEYYEATREKAIERYDTATPKAGEVVTKTRDAATRQAGTISAAVEAGKKAYIEEKRRAESSFRETKTRPTLEEKEPS